MDTAKKNINIFDKIAAFSLAYSNTIMAFLMIIVMSLMNTPKEAIEDVIFQKYSGVYLFYSEYHSFGLIPFLKECFLYVLDRADKIVHFCFYALFSLVFFFDYRINRKNLFHPFLVSAVFAFFVGYFCEVCQGFTDTRSYSYNDMITNGTGASICMFISFLISKFYARPRKQTLLNRVKPHRKFKKQRHNNACKPV